METLLSHILLTTASTSTALLDGIRLAVLNHLEDVQSACIVAADATPWLEAKLPYSLVLWKDFTLHQDQIVEGYVLDIRANEQWSTNQLRALRRIASTKFVIVTMNQDQKSLSQSVLKFGLCNVLILTETATGMVAHPANEPCSGPGQNFMETAETPHCLINASYMDFPPINFYSDGRVSGWEGSVLQTTADILKFKVNWTNRHESMWPELLEDASSGRCLAGMGCVYGFHFRWVVAELIPTCYPVTMAFVSPLHAGPSRPTWSIILVSELSPQVWIVTFLTYISLVLLSALFSDEGFNDRDLVYTPFHIMALILGTSQNFVLHRGFTLTIIFFGFMITIYYQAVMSSKLTAPAKPAELTSWEEMLATNWTIKGNIPMKKMLKSSADAYPDDPIKQEMYNRYIPDLGTLEENLLRVVNKENELYGRHTSNIMYTSQLNPLLKGKLHIIEEPVITFIANTLMPKHSCLAEKFQHTHFRICASGLAYKWYKDLNVNQPMIEDGGVKKLEIAHIKGFLLLLLLGWILSLTAFMVEFLTGVLRKCKKNNLNDIIFKGKTKNVRKILVKPRAS